METTMEKYAGTKLIDIPSGMGGTLPAAIAADHGETLQVVCLHHEFYTNWILTVKKSETKPFSYHLTNGMKKIIQSRKAGAA